MEEENQGLEQQDQVETEVDLTDQTVEDTGGDSDQGQAQSLPEMEIERNGQVIKVSAEDAKKYTSMGYDYTQKTQDLANERTAFNAERDTLKPYQELATYLQTNPEKAQAVYEALQQEQGEVDPLQQKVGQLDNMVNQLVQQNSQEKLSGMLSSINNDEKYGGLFKDPDMEELMLATALQTKKQGEKGLREVADKIHSKWFKASVDSEKKGENKVIKNLSSPTRKGVTGTGSYAPPKDFNPAKSSWKDIGSRAVEMLG